jgi:hypothetical protein
MSARGVVDAVLAGTGGAALQPRQLRDEALIVEEVDGARIDGRKQFEIEVGFGLGRGMLYPAELRARRLLARARLGSVLN